MTENRRESMRGVTERRAFLITEREWRAKPDGSGGQVLAFRGYASLFNSPYEMCDLWGDTYTEVVREGAFTRTLNTPDLDVPLLYGHNSRGMPTMARTKSGTLQLSQDTEGLLVEADLDGQRSDVRDLSLAMDRGDVDEMSFAFMTRKQEWSPDWTQRDLLELDIHRGDVSIVALAANPATAGAGVRSAFDVVERLDDDELRAMYERLGKRLNAPAETPAQRAPLNRLAAQLGF
jgi:HK97 family phage prohead protease